MCLVEVSNNRKLQVACATTLSENLKVNTSSMRVQKAREAVLEFLLVNHPLDCPICDQAGECDLQDLTFLFAVIEADFTKFKKELYKIRISLYDSYYNDTMYSLYKMY